MNFHAHVGARKVFALNTGCRLTYPYLLQHTWGITWNPCRLCKARRNTNLDQTKSNDTFTVANTSPPTAHTSCTPWLFSHKLHSPWTVTCIVQSEEHLLCKWKVPGSNPGRSLGHFFRLVIMPHASLSFKLNKKFVTELVFQLAHAHPTIAYSSTSNLCLLLYPLCSTGVFNGIVYQRSLDILRFSLTWRWCKSFSKIIKEMRSCQDNIASITVLVHHRASTDCKKKRTLHVTWWGRWRNDLHELFMNLNCDYAMADRSHASELLDRKGTKGIGNLCRFLVFCRELSQQSVPFVPTSELVSGLANLRTL